MKRSVLGLLAVALWTTRSVVTGVTEKAESCDLTHGEWLHDASVAKRIARSVSDRPAEKMSNYDCSSYLQSMRLPNIDHYTHTLPFCERVPDEKLQKLVQKSVEWYWKPHDCNMKPFDPVKFAQLLARSKEAPNGRWLYFVGDSTLMHMYDSLVCLLGPSVVDATESRHAREELDAVYHTLPKIQAMRKLGVLALNGGGRVYFLRSNRLVSEKSGMVNAEVHRLPRVLVQHVPVDPEADGVYENENDDEYIEYVDYFEMEIPWVRQIRHGEEGKHDVLMFNTGFHGGVDKHLVEHVLLYFKQNFNGRLLYRTNIPGSHDCLENSKAKGQASAGPLSFHWENFAQWDRIWKDGATMHHPSLEFFDISELSTKRRDSHPIEFYGHVDCLHFCLPGGPVDAWNSILFNMLLAPKSTRASP
jgi:hypothetical protein